MTTNKIIEGTLPAGSRLRIGVPAEQPTEAMTALQKLFEDIHEVREARLGLMEVLPPNGAPFFTYTIGWTARGNRQGIELNVMNVLQGVQAGRWPISVFPLNEDYFTNEAIVFFKRSDGVKDIPLLGRLVKLFRK